MAFATLVVFLISSSNVLAKMYTPGVETGRIYKDFSDHTRVTDSNVFPYAVAVLKKYSYLSAGALLADQWVLTAADALFLVRESSRIIKVRLGSINYKKGGELLSVKAIIVHPLFDDSRPLYDLALMMLSDRVWLTPTLNPIRPQIHLREVTATHFIVTAWTPLLKTTETVQQLTSLDSIKQRRMLSVSHLHPSDPETCVEDLGSLEINDTQSIMCLEPDFKSDPCWRDTGAPVVLNGILWGIVSSWRPDDCYARRTASFVTLVAARNVRSWLLATTRGLVWNRTQYDEDTDSEMDFAENGDSNEI